MEDQLFPLRSAVPQEKPQMPSMEYVHQELKRKGVTLQLLWHEYKEKGLSGVGKTFLVCQLAYKACREGFRTLYLRFSQFFCQMALSLADGSYGTLTKRFTKTHLLVLDDLGLVCFSDTERRDLLQVIEVFCNAGSALITSQLPIENWYGHICDLATAEAILDWFFS